MKTNPFYYQRVTTINELRRFIENYYEVSGNVLPEEYLARAIVYQFYIGPHAVAGFVLNTVEMNRLRTTSYLSEQDVQRMMNDEDLSELDMLEIAANYKLKTVGSNESIIYYRVMLAKTFWHAQRENKTYIVAGSVIKALQKVHQTLLKRVIHAGPISVEHQAKVKGEAPRLKIYAANVKGFPTRAVLALMNRYVIRAVKNRIKRAFLKKPARLNIEKQQPNTQQKSVSEPQ